MTMGMYLVTFSHLLKFHRITCDIYRVICYIIYVFFYSATIVNYTLFSVVNEAGTPELSHSQLGV